MKERELLARVLTSELWSVQEELQTEIKELLAQPYSESGMTLRDHFAGLAMQGLLSSDINTPKWNKYEIALLAYGQADAMLVERDKKNE